MGVQFLLDRAAESPAQEALVWRGQTLTYGELHGLVTHWSSILEDQPVPPHAVVILEGDYSPNSIALLLALFARHCIVAPLAHPPVEKARAYAQTAQGEFQIRIADDDTVAIEQLGSSASHPLYRRLVDADHAGLVLFTSGSTGEGKAALHDISMLLEKFQTRRHDLRTLAFLLYDHIGGIDTLLYSLSNTSCLVTVPDRSPTTVCAAVESAKVEVLPASPSFLNLLLLSKCHRDYDLRSLKYITYGSEIMPELTLRRIHTLFPDVTLLQKFGTTEVGTLRSQSRGPESTWIRMGGEGYQVRVVDGILHIKARSAILGYLNAPDPFTEDGWFITGDRVEVDGEFMRVLGRDSEIINVGGEKVYPAEVENVIQEVDNVVEATVRGQSHALMGNIVCARITVGKEEDERVFARRIKARCRAALEPYKVPVRIEFCREAQHSDRFKKMRGAQ